MVDNFDVNISINALHILNHVLLNSYESSMCPVTIRCIFVYFIRQSRALRK